MTAFTDHLQTVLSTIEARLTEPVGRSQITPGTPAWDNCCDGQLSVWITNVQALSRPNCPPHAYTYTLAAQVIRCIASVNDQGNAPKPGVVTEDGLHIVQDMENVRDAIRCDLPASDMPEIGSWFQLEPMGGCSGGQWSFTLTWPA